MPYSNTYICEIPECDKVRKNKMYCPAHYKRWKKWGNPLGNAPHGNNLKHLLCTVDGCKKKHTAKGMCQMHYRRNALYGSALTTKPRGRTDLLAINSDGYLIIYNPEHPNANLGGMVLHHRFVMSEHLKRPLTKDEVVHHKNGDRSDNRIENLELWVKGQPAGQRVEDKVEYAIQILERYAPEYLAKAEA
jgi:hypothetical protein